MPKRIAQILGRMDSGGIEAVVMNYYNLLDKTQVQFDFFVDENSSLPQKEAILTSGGRIFYLPNYSNIWQYCKVLRKYLKAENYMIVHAHMSTMSLFPLCVAWSVKVPIRIAHSHSTASLYEWKKSMLKYMLRPFAKVFATDYFACGEVAGRWLFSDKTFEKGEVFIMENIIDYKKYAFNLEYRTQILDEFDIANSDLVVGHIGRFCQQKNQLYLLEIFAYILEKEPTAKLVLVGEGEQYLAKVKARAGKLNIANSIIFAGVRFDTHKFYSAFDIFLLPSLYEGMPMVAIEAKANGLPMIVSNNVTNEVEQISLDLNKNSTEFWCNKTIENARKILDKME